MAKPYIKGGTPIGSASLCKTCSYAHIMTGYRESEMVTMCNEIHPNIVVPFFIYECTGYYDKNRPDWKQMEKLAIDVTPSPMKPVGFKVGVGFHEAAIARPRVEEFDGDDDDD
ncbi:MAG TPA: hypothetical protein VIX42_11885 [Edaphobacter sp.]